MHNDMVSDIRCEACHSACHMVPNEGEAAAEAALQFLQLSRELLRKPLSSLDSLWQSVQLPHVHPSINKMNALSSLLRI